jgi:hypothetical protein
MQKYVLRYWTVFKEQHTDNMVYVYRETCTVVNGL